MQTLKAHLLFLFCLFFVSTAMATDLPSPPEGYTWVRCDEIKGAFLKPSGWHFKKEEQGNALGYFITKENIDTKGEFLTGLSINVVTDIPKKSGVTSSKYAATYIQTAANEREVLKRPWSNNMGPFQGYGVVLRNRDRQKGDYMTHNLAIANDKTGTLYLITFEAPAANWDTSWAVGKPMLQRFLIDDSI